MAIQKGKDLLLKVLDGSSYVTVAGLRSRRIAFNAQAVDTTHADSSGRWRELLAGAGLKRASVSGSGVFKDAASDALVRTAFFDGTLKTWQVLIPDFGTVTGPFQISALEMGGDHDREVTFDLTLESAGELVFAAL
ncbi:phage major tail protein, TP901-1 family [Aquabacter cavernae]|uniref:phage major tail protein, TP901-1 family n=1 Tax=Aquabacter cavernae TaxID=2496029 RepID=UPI000F8D98A2|nr:phage major tail protein, TP901-1 family [Aquabacter cavernae]